MRRNCRNARVFFEVEGAEIPAPGEPGLNRVGYWYRLLTLVFHTSAYQTAEVDERLARVAHLGDAETDLTGGALGLSNNARRADHQSSFAPVAAAA